MNKKVSYFSLECSIYKNCFQTRKEREIQQQMMSQDEETLELRDTFTSLQQEVEAKTKKLKKVEPFEWSQNQPAGYIHYINERTSILDPN